MYEKSGNKDLIDVLIAKAETDTKTAGGPANNLRYAVKGGDCKQCGHCNQFISATRWRRHEAPGCSSKY